ncbi:MAG: hypothetical protein FJ087_23175 [Deltaproteobacteria bacterium]|nr:hypothetical protein [Deltaproteobacteria bacterium]
MVGETVPILTVVAVEAGLMFRSDEPIWYVHPETDQQRIFYGDLVLARPVDPRRVTADDLLLAMEVVSTHDRRKALKDTLFQRLLNEYNDVPEFALLFPDLEDPRALTWYRLVEEGRYEEQIVAPGGRVSSRAVPELELRVLPRDRWSPGYKVDIYYRGELRPRMAAVLQRAGEEKARADEEKARAEKEKARAEKEKARADRLAERLRELGIDNDH